MTGAKDFIELFLRQGSPVLVAFVLYRIINLVFDWLSRYEAAGLFRALFNRRRQHLEKMLSQTYLSRETRNLARAELNQMSRRKLTGFSEPHLQEKLTRICLRHNLSSRYFTRWRTYLSEKMALLFLQADGTGLYGAFFYSSICRSARCISDLCVMYS